tara:strand:+ start:1180 stop:1968 length:789 start_codon:yes stop_codon:yes gene_type:complete
MTGPSATPRRPLPGRTVATYLIWIAAGAAVLFLASTIVVLTNIDNPAGADLRVTESFFTAGIDHPPLFSLAEFLAWLGGARNIAFITVAVLVLAYTRAWPWAVFFLGLSAGSIALSNLVKFSVGRERPPWVTHEAPQQTLSFPSGHTLTGITVWCAAALIGVVPTATHHRSVVVLDLSGHRTASGASANDPQKALEYGCSRRASPGLGFPVYRLVRLLDLVAPEVRHHLSERRLQRIPTRCAPALDSHHARSPKTVGPVLFC